MGLAPETLPPDTDIAAPVLVAGKPAIARAPADWIVALCCASVALIFFAAAVAQVFLFAQTDAVAAQLIQAGLLIGGVAALAVVPFGVVAWTALRARPRPVWTTVLLLPWVAVGALWIALSRFDWLIGAVPMAVAALAIVWAWVMRPKDTHSKEPLPDAPLPSGAPSPAAQTEPALNPASPAR